MLKYFYSSILFSIIGLIGCFSVGYYYGGTVQSGLSSLFIGFFLSVLEISLSFDNAIVNAVILKKMTPEWRHRFITWGMAIAVFGMRFVFPLAIVAVAANISPVGALIMAIGEPQKYADLMQGAHIEVASFGGTFLMMVCLKYFYDENKDVHWIKWFEQTASMMGKIEAIEIGTVLAVLVAIANNLPAENQIQFLVSGVFGLLVFILVDGISTFLELSENTVRDIQKASAGMFLYLEVLDASFSFDGVVGAFAITNNLFIIMLGLSIGAFFVRSLTILFVEKDTLSKFLYLEHGAFYAIGILATIMLLDVFLHIPEWVTGLLGGAVILISLVWSIVFKSKEVL